MKLYRTTRYTSTGFKLWARLSSTTGRYAATCGDITYGGGVTLEVMEIDESQFQQIKTKGKVPTE